MSEGEVRAGPHAFHIVQHDRGLEWVSRRFSFWIHGVVHESSTLYAAIGGLCRHVSTIVYIGHTGADAVTRGALNA